MVSYFVIVTVLHLTKTFDIDYAKDNTTISEITVPPVITIISIITAILLSPKAEAFTAQTFKSPHDLFNIKVATASLSKSSHIINNKLFSFMACSKNGKTDYTLVIFLSVK